MDTHVIIIASFDRCLIKEVYWMELNTLSVYGLRIVLFPPLSVNAIVELASYATAV